MDAVKVMDLKAVAKAGMQQKFLDREIKALIDIRHPNVLKVSDIFRASGNLYIFMEFAPNGTLLTKLKKTPGSCLSEAKAKFWFKQCVDALTCMHMEHHMAHRDIKLDNVLFDASDNAKLSDFGFAREWGGKSDTLAKTFCGTEPYYAPEIVARQPYNPFLYDVWSMGVMLFIMLNGKFPFHFKDLRKKPRIMLSEMKNRSYKYNENV